MSLCALQHFDGDARPSRRPFPTRSGRTTSNNVKLPQIRDPLPGTHTAVCTRERGQRSAYTAEANERAALYLDLLGGVETQPSACVNGSPLLAASGCNSMSERQLHFEQVHAEVRELLGEWKSVLTGTAREAAASAIQVEPRAREIVASARRAIRSASAQQTSGEALPASLGVDSDHPIQLSPISPRHLHRTAVERVRQNLETLRDDPRSREELFTRVALMHRQRREEVYGSQCDNHIARNALEVWESSTPQSRMLHIEQRASQHGDRAQAARQRAAELRRRREATFRTQHARREKALRYRKAREDALRMAELSAEWSLVTALASRTAKIAAALDSARHRRAVMWATFKIQVAVRLACVRFRRSREARFSAVLAKHIWVVRLHRTIHRKHAAAVAIRHFLELCEAQGRMLMAVKMFGYNVRFLQSFSRRLALHRAAHVELLVLQCKKAEVKLYPLRPAKDPATHAPTNKSPGSGAQSLTQADIPKPPDQRGTSSSLGVYDKHVPRSLLCSAVRDKLVEMRVQYFRATARGSRFEVDAVRWPQDKGRDLGPERLPILFSAEQMRGVLEDARRRMHTYISGAEAASLASAAHHVT